MHIGKYALPGKVILAPMAGISDRPFRELCKQFGASLAVSEMVASNPDLRMHGKTLLKADHSGESGLRSVQIVGTDPRQMADAARFNADRGAQIIDINMGCPAKKVCKVAAGSALMKNEKLAANILSAVVAAVDIPVTLKMRTGWDVGCRNAVRIAQIASDSGVSALAVHGRTRACKFEGKAEYETIRQVKLAVDIPVVANGDIDTPEKAHYVLEQTGADAVMIGRAACGNPWLFTQVEQFLDRGVKADKPSVAVLRDTVLTHLEKLYQFYGNTMGVKIARKHLGWYFKPYVGISRELLEHINQASLPSHQAMLVNMALDQIT